MTEFAVYMTDHSNFPDKDVFYVFDTDTIEDALAEAQEEQQQIAASWGASLRVEFALPVAAARLAVDGSGSVELRDASELTAYRAGLQRRP
ncbi:hypothetical protein G6L37_04900 [Agrobacterium rubi]|nr:hypothetical protein [Agrobacterium rubi]NTF24693.1 hypothetical protein [Agrobacterium rubi]